MLLQLCVRLPDDRVSMRIGLENEHGVHAFFGTIDGTNDGGLMDTGLHFERAFDVLGKDVQPVGPHDHFLLASLDEQAPLRIAFADVAGV